MSAPAPRGRPVTFDTHQRTRYLDALTNGANLTEAAATAGITARWAARIAATDPAFAAARNTARTAGRRVRADHMPHGETRYIKHHCRCDICTKHATTNRTGRRNRPTDTTPTEPAPEPAKVTAMPNQPAPSSSSLLLARAS
ncbi:hypothetical protein [Streptomyces sp. NPDC018584]|uniref:hypothetical protein n=1 Tax=unclassified Streptomyces TaxID=2593676 RepID=UPI0037A3B30B